MNDAQSTLPVHPAATILLLRDGPDGLEVFMQQRHHEIDRFSGALVFPGGKVEAQDRDPQLRTRCRLAADIDDDALALRIAAIREAFEECGVLLARPRGDDALVDAARLTTLGGERDALNAGTLQLRDLLERQDLELACDQLVRYAHWITPQAAIKRFDTHFYLAPVPVGQQLLHDGRESVDSLWITPEAALRGVAEERLTIVFPTKCNLQKLQPRATVADALGTAAATPVVTVQPQVDRREDGVYVRIPAEAGYPVCEEKQKPRSKTR
jgi:8-oxo-dGTP pyrophosphatase MutT (NUDIX family)